MRNKGKSTRAPDLTELNLQTALSVASEFQTKAEVELRKVQKYSASRYAVAKPNSAIKGRIQQELAFF